MIGIHITKHGLSHSHNDLLETMKSEVAEYRLNCVQIFTHGPRTYTKNKLDISKIRAFCHSNQLSLTIHTPYPITSIWSGKYYKKFIEMLKLGAAIGAKYIIVHLPIAEPEIIEKTLTALSEYQEPQWPRILLEMPASKPSPKTYETAAKLNSLVAVLKKNMIKWGLCIDISHQFAGGIDFGKIDIFQKWLTEITPLTRSKIKMFHLNGNQKQHFGRGKDIHEIIMGPHDAIWGHLMSREMKDFLVREEHNDQDFFSILSSSEIQKIRESSLGAIVKFAKQNHIELIMEINRGKPIYTKYAIDIIRGLRSPSS